jgi:hypothetical protein
MVFALRFPSRRWLRMVVCRSTGCGLNAVKDSISCRSARSVACWERILLLMGFKKSLIICVDLVTLHATVADGGAGGPARVYWMDGRRTVGRHQYFQTTPDASLSGIPLWHSTSIGCGDLTIQYCVRLCVRSAWNALADLRIQETKRLSN